MRIEDGQYSQGNTATTNGGDDTPKPTGSTRDSESSGKKTILPGADEPGCQVEEEAKGKANVTVDPSANGHCATGVVEALLPIPLENI